MLKRLYVDNVRCLSNFEFVPGKVALLVGPNGGGKSSVYRVLGALAAFLQGGLAENVFPRLSLTRWEKRRKQRFEVEAEGADENTFSYSVELKHLEDGRSVRIDEERLTVNGGLVYRFAGGEVQLFGDDSAAAARTSFPFSPTRSFIPLLEPRPDNQLIMSFRDWVSRIWLFAPQPQLIGAASEAESRALSADTTNFVSWYRWVVQEQPRVAEALRTELTPMIPGLTDINLVATSPTTKYMNVHCTVGGVSFALDPSELSDGQRALMVLYAIKHAITKRASVLFFDEPDNYLAQREIQPWLSGLRESIDEANATLLVISHHPEVIDYLAPDQVLRLWRADEGPTRIEAMEFDRATGLKASEALLLETP